MNDPFDLELSDRLAGLAAAVPGEAPGSTIVVRPRIRSGVVGRRFAFGGLVPVLALLVIGTLIAGVAKLGPFAPGSTTTPTTTGTADVPNGPVIAMATDGQFELTIRSTKARYLTDEPIEIGASLTYRGSDPIQIAHGQGARGTALGFGIDEPVLGDLRLTPGVRESCERSTLEPGAPLNVAFEKSGGFSGSDPRAAEYRDYFDDPVLRLPVGTWHVYGVAGFSIDNCSPDPVELRVVIEIQVLEAAPTASEAPQAPNAPQAETVRDGDFELTLRAGKARYLPMEPIDITASLTYYRPRDEIQITHDSAGPVMFGIREKVFGEIFIGGVSLLMCGGSTLVRGVPVTEVFKKSGGFSGEHPDAASFLAWMKDPVLRLPAGTWHITAAAGGPCMSDGPAFSLHAELVIVVEDPSATPGPTPTPYDYGIADGDAIDDLTLELRSKKSIYAVGEAIEISASYTPVDVETERTMRVAYFAPEMAFSIEQLNAPNAKVAWTKVYDTACVDLTLARGEPRQIDPSNDNLMSMRAVTLPPDFEAMLGHGVLRLPEGRWRISASVITSLGSCAETNRDARALRASIEITVGNTTP